MDFHGRSRRRSSGGRPVAPARLCKVCRLRKTSFVCQKCACHSVKQLRQYLQQIWRVKVHVRSALEAEVARRQSLRSVGQVPVKRRGSLARLRARLALQRRLWAQERAHVRSVRTAHAARRQRLVSLQALVAQCEDTIATNKGKQQQVVQLHELQVQVCQQHKRIFDILLRLYSLKRKDADHCSVAGVVVPDHGEFLRHRTENASVSTGVGYVALLLRYFSYYTGVELPYQPVFLGSRSFIRLGVPAAVHPSPKRQLASWVEQPGTTMVPLYQTAARSSFAIAYNSDERLDASRISLTSPVSDTLVPRGDFDRRGSMKDYGDSRASSGGPLTESTDFSILKAIGAAGDPPARLGGDLDFQLGLRMLDYSLRFLCHRALIEPGSVTPLCFLPNLLVLAECVLRGRHGGLLQPNLASLPPPDARTLPVAVTLDTGLAQQQYDALNLLPADMDLHAFAPSEHVPSSSSSLFLVHTASAVAPRAVVDTAGTGVPLQAAAVPSLLGRQHSMASGAPTPPPYGGRSIYAQRTVVPMGSGGGGGDAGPGMSFIQVRTGRGRGNGNGNGNANGSPRRHKLSHRHQLLQSPTIARIGLSPSPRTMRPSSLDTDPSFQLAKRATSVVPSLTGAGGLGLRLGLDLDSDSATSSHTGSLTSIETESTGPSSDCSSVSPSSPLANVYSSPRSLPGAPTGGQPGQIARFLVEQQGHDTRQQPPPPPQAGFQLQPTLIASYATRTHTHSSSAQQASLDQSFQPQLSSDEDEWDFVVI